MTKWLKAEGDEINEYDAVMELSTDTLYAPGDAPVEGAPVEMIVELAEVGFVGKLLAAEGDFVEVRMRQDRISSCPCVPRVAWPMSLVMLMGRFEGG